MKKIRVMHILPSFLPGGAERMAVHIVRGLNEQRFEVAITSVGQRIGSDLERLLDESRMRVWYLGKKLGFDCRTYYRLHRVLRDYRPDIIHTHLQVLRYALPSMLWFKRNSMLLHTVNNVAEREVEPSARWIQRYAFRHGVLPVAVAKEVAASLERLYGIQSCQVIFNCIPTKVYGRPQISRPEWRAKEGFAEDDVLFACVARFAPQKNHALLLRAFAQGPASDRKAHLLLVGDGSLRAQLQEQAKNLDLAGQVHFLGVRTDIPDVLGAMDVFVLTSDWEGNPLSVVEAMASGLPIVSTAAGGVPELMENGKEGFLLQVGDLRGLADCMSALLKSPETRRSFANAAARRARDFDVSVMIGAYEELYENLYRHLQIQQKGMIGESVLPTEEWLMGQQR
ncbi:MAG: glycosyl transferase [Acidobacteria bacterium]|nr:MAG: glycosyl transferase [Acidobacteriota bacterium]